MSNQPPPPPGGTPAPPPPGGYPPPGSAEQAPAYQGPGGYPGQQGGYPPPQQPGYYGPQQKTNGMAIAALVLGILWLYWIGSILALIFGYLGRKQIDQSGGAQTGRGMATAGIVLGWIGVGILVLFVILAIIGASLGGLSGF